MQTIKDIIIRLKQVRDEKGLSLNNIYDLIENSGDSLSKSSIQRVFADGSEDMSFKYEETIRPIAKVLLDMETIEADDNMDTAAMKSLLKYKIQRIEDLEHQIRQLKAQLDKEKIRYHEKMEKERNQWANSIEFLKHQVSLKDKRMDFLLDAVKEKDRVNQSMLDHILNCPFRDKPKVTPVNLIEG